MPFAVQFPKYVQVENFRLVLFYWLVSAAVLVWVVIQFVNARSYLEYKIPQGSVQFWAEKWFNRDVALASNERDTQKEHCTNPSKFHYCYDTACGWDYKDFQCMELCAGDVKGDCMHDSERWVKEDSGIFFPTYFNESIVKLISSTESIETSRQWFAVGLESLAIGFDHEYFVENTAGQPERGKSKQVEGSTYKNGIRTILLDKNGDTVESWDPGKSVSLSIQTILDVGGIDLDSINREQGPNYKEGAEISDGMLTRITGVEIGIWMSYANPEQHGKEWEGPICYLDIAASAVWTSKPALQVLDNLGSTRLRYKQGLRIRFYTAGSFAWIYGEAIIAGITSAIVFLGLGKTLVMFFSFHMLGNLSRIYKHVIVSRVNLAKECYGSVARLLSHSSAFLELEDTNDGISRRQLYARLKWLFKDANELDEDEVDHLAKVCFEGMVAKDTGAIGIQEFGVASSSTDNVTFKSLVQLFDKDRPKMVLEKIFSDQTIAGLTWHHNESHTANGSASSVVPDPKKTKGVTSQSESTDELQARCRALEAQCQQFQMYIRELQKDRNELKDAMGLSLQAQSSEQSTIKELQSIVKQLKDDAEQAKSRERVAGAELKRQSEKLSAIAAQQSQSTRSFCSTNRGVTPESITVVS